MRKITLWSVFSVVGAHILHVQIRKRNRNKTLKHAHSRLISMDPPVMSQADACSYCMGSVVLISSQIYLYLQLLCAGPRNTAEISNKSLKADLDFWFQGPISVTYLISNFIIGHWNRPSVYTQKCFSSTTE